MQNTFFPRPASHRFTLRALWFVLVLLLIYALPIPSFAAPATWPKQYTPHLADKVDGNEPVEVIVLLDDATEQLDEARESREKVPLFKARGEDYRQRMEKRKSRMKNLKTAVLSEAADTDLEIITDYPVLPVMHVRISSSRALAKLSRHHKVLSIDENIPHEKYLSQSLPLIERTNAQVSSYNGENTTVAVLDTGVDYTHAAFGACSTPGANCKVVHAQDFATSDGSLDDNGHGTNVAAIVLGVAPSAKIAALDVFRTDGYAYSSDLISAIDWCVTNKGTYNIASINMSLGAGKYNGPVTPSDSWGTAIQRAIDVGIVVAAASGNSGYTDSMGLPAAYSNVVSVGAVYDSNVGSLRWSLCRDPSTAADKVTCFSNSASFLTMLAPGAIISAADVTMGGTSQAAPHVAGAAAVFRSLYPNDTVGQTVARLRQGKDVTDARNSVVTPRLNLATAIGTTSTYALETNVTPAGAGQVTPANGLFAPGTWVTLAATPNVGYSFTGWGGACLGTEGTCEVVMDGNKTVSATFTAVPMALTNGVAVSNLSDTVDMLKHFYIDVPSGVTSLTFETSGGTGDVDLYTRRDSLPTTSSYDCAPDLLGNAEICTYSYPAAGRYYASLYAVTEYSGVTLQANYETASTTQSVQMSATSYSISEGGGSITIPVFRQGGTTGMVTVNFATANGTAAAPSDYSSTSGTLSWAAGDSSTKSIRIRIKNDRTKEGDETLTLNLSGPTGAVLGANQTATITIIDND